MGGGGGEGLGGGRGLKPHLRFVPIEFILFERFLTHSYLKTRKRVIQCRQTLQTQIRRLIMWHLIRVYSVCLQDFPLKID